VATVAMGLGAAAVAAGAALYLLAPRSRTPAVAVIPETGGASVRVWQAW